MICGFHEVFLFPCQAKIDLLYASSDDTSTSESTTANVSMQTAEMILKTSIQEVDILVTG